MKNDSAGMGMMYYMAITRLERKDSPVRKLARKVKRLVGCTHA